MNVDQYLTWPKHLNIIKVVIYPQAFAAQLTSYVPTKQSLEGEYVAGEMEGLISLCELR